LPVGVAQHEHERRAGAAHRLGVEVDAADGGQARVLAEDVVGLDADRAAAGLRAHRRVERQAGGRAGRRDLEPAVLALLAERRVAATSQPSFSV
jgi:hypothetical protein